MHKANLEYDGDNAILRLELHSGESASISCTKATSQSFRLSFTGANEILVVGGTITAIRDGMVVIDSGGKELQALTIIPGEYRIGQNVYATEYYGLDMETESPKFVVSSRPIEEPRLLFVNVDCLDGGGNIIKRYRVSPYTGSFKVIT